MRWRLRWWWFKLRRELRHRFVCRRLGHELEWNRREPIDLDAIHYWPRCERCHRSWPGFTVTHTVVRLFEGSPRILAQEEMARYERRIWEAEAR